MDENQFLDLVMRYQDATLTPDERARLEQALASEETKRRLYAETLLQSAALCDQFRQDAVYTPVASRKETWTGRVRTHSALATAMLILGIMVGLIGSGVVLAMTKVRLVITTEELSILRDGGFESQVGGLSLGFPRRSGVWGGDRTEVVTSGATQGSHRLQFVQAEADPATPQGRAIACDLFQLVNLRDLPQQPHGQDSSSLELSARFLDARAGNTQPSVTFFCQIYLFRGDLTTMHETWPTRISEAVSSGSAEVTTLGDSGWRLVTARCLSVEDADFAVVHIAARPNLRGPMPADLFADDVKLTLKTRPSLPEQIVDR